MYKKYIYWSIATISVLFLVGYYIVQMQQEKEITDLIKRLKSEESAVREKAVNEIPKYKNKAVKPLMNLLMENQNESILADAILSFVQIRSAEAASALIKFLQQTHKMQNEVTGALVNIGKPAVEPLFKAYDSSDYYTKVLILNTLNNLSPKFLLDKKINEDIKKLYLKAFLQENSIYVRKTVLSFLGQSQFDNDPTVKLVIRNALKDKNGDIRAIALIILQRGKGELYPDKTEIDRIANVISGLEYYHALHKMFPNNLNSLVKEEFVKKEFLKNPWGYPYIYEIAKDKESIKLISLGKDGKQNTDDDSVIAWETEPERR